MKKIDTKFILLPVEHGGWDCNGNISFKGCGMGPLLVLVSPCFRENVDLSHAKFGLFFCNLDNLLQKNVIVFFLEIKFQNGAHLQKGLFLTYFSHFLVTREKLQKFLRHVSHSHTYSLNVNEWKFHSPIEWNSCKPLKKEWFCTLNSKFPLIKSENHSKKS